ncbi:HAD family hydrolase [Streptomyces sp. NBC_00829]|uniref:HAD family hydrolase n=1 Tax=Streptomyces sp. NBC_00829 TaxID=2903679 RepID=UPI00386ED670|nr:HAD hydrolase-like protein [Streptomyces sp. NBC_00829]
MAHRQSALCPDGRSDVTDSHNNDLARRFADATCVLFDFDGPVCHLFDGHPAREVAAELRGWAARNMPGGVSVPPEFADDPLALLRAAARSHPGSPLVGQMERHLAAQEELATLTAAPTEGADRLIGRLSAAGFRLAVTTNNCAEAARSYLDRTGLAVFFGEHIHGREPDPLLMKPDPDCLRRALRSTGSTEAEALMIGDSPADCLAAHTLGVPFLGYARNESKRLQLSDAGAKVIVATMSELLPVLDDLPSGLPVPE